MNKGQNFFIALTMSLAGGIWLILYPPSLVTACLTAILVSALWWLPWDRMKTARLVLSALAAALTLWSTWLLLQQTVCDMLPPWQIAMAMFLLILLFCRTGKRALFRSGVLLGGALTVLLIYLFLRCIPLYHAASLYLSSSWKPWLGILVLLGAGLSAWQEESDATAVRLGGMTGCALWLSVALTAALSWSREALGKIYLPAVTAWQRVDLLSVLSCPDVIAVSLLSVCALVQCCAVILSLFALQKNKNRV